MNFLPQASSSPSFRKVMSCFASGVAIVTVKTDSEFHGMTLNSLTSVSLDPPLLLVCLAKLARTTLAIRKYRRFAVNILAENQSDISNRFSRPGQDHFQGLDMHLDQQGLPVLQGAIAYLICKVHSVYTASDHDIVLGEVLEASWQVGRPLIYYRSCYHALGTAGGEATLDWYW